MKYLKATLALFIVTFMFAVMNANANTQKVTLTDITIPILKGTYVSSQEDKEFTNTQYIKKTKCKDDVSGDGRVILARVKAMFSNVDGSEWVEAKPKKNIAFDDESKKIGGWKLWLQSNKNLLTTASFWGEWTVN